MSGSRPPSETMSSLFSAVIVSCILDSGLEYAADSPLTARLPKAALAARCTSASWLVKRYNTGSKVSLPTSLTSFSVISAKAKAADRCRSTLSEKERVVRAAKGEPVKKLVVVRSKRCQLQARACGFQLPALSKRHAARIGTSQLTFEVLQQIRHGLSLILQQQRLVRVLSALTA